MSKKPAVRVEPATEHGEGAWLYSDGSIRRKGAFVRRPPYACDMITQETAPILAQRRHELAKERAAEGLQRAVAKYGLAHATPEEAWGGIIEVQAELGLSVEQGHASTQAAKLVGHAAGMLQAAQAPQVDRRSVTINVTADVAERLRLLSGVAHAGERMQASEAGADAEFRQLEPMDDDEEFEEC